MNLSTSMRRRSWKHVSGRTDGAESYQFGDFTRGIITKVSSFMRRESVRDRLMKDASGELSVARQIVEELVGSCTRLRDKDFPNNEDKRSSLESIQSAIGRIQSCLSDLDNMLRGAQTHSNSMPEVLQTQMCTAAKDQEWSVGLLTLRTDGLVFTSSSEPQWILGPVQWERIEHTDLFANGDLHLCIRGEKSSHILSGIRDAQVLQFLEERAGLRRRLEQSCDEFDSCDEFEGQHESNGDAAIQSLGEWLVSNGAPQEGLLISDVQDTMVTSPNRRCQDELVMLPEDELVRSPELYGSNVPPVLDVSPALTVSMMAVDNRLPPAEAPRKASPVLQAHIPHISISSIRERLYADDAWPLQIYLEQEMHSHDMQATRWTKGERVPGTHVRRLQFKMPLPADVPKFVQKLVKLPKETAVTLVARIGSSDDLVVLLVDVVTHDVTYGNDFIIREVLSFKPHPQGGSLFTKFVEVQWMNALPWYAAVVGTFVEMKAKEDGKKSGEALQRYLEPQVVVY